MPDRELVVLVKVGVIGIRGIGSRHLDSLSKIKYESLSSVRVTKVQPTGLLIETNLKLALLLPNFGVRNVCGLQGRLVEGANLRIAG